MYQPEHFKIDDIAQMQALMRARPFATLVSSGSLGLFATQLPTVLKAQSDTQSGNWGVIECHLARANPHWRDLASGAEALMIFHGPDAYVSPNWYPTKAATQKVVPTWNYATVHAYGRPAIMEDGAWKRAHVAELTDQQERIAQPPSGHEPPLHEPWALSDAPEDYVQIMLRGIVGFRFMISRLEGKSKMSQNREKPDRDGVQAGLTTRGQGEDDKIAALVRASAPS